MQTKMLINGEMVTGEGDTLNAYTAIRHAMLAH